MDLRRIAALREELDKHRRARDRAEGAAKECLERLRKEYGCATVEKAEEEIDKLETDIKDAEADVEEKVRTYEELLLDSPRERE